MSSPPLPVKQEEPDVWVTLTGSVDIDDNLADELDGIEIDDTNDIHFEIDGEDVTPEELGITDVKIKFSKEDIDDID